MKVLYLTHDVYSDGGIQRFSRYEIRALQEVVGDESVTVCSLCDGVTPDGTPLPVAVHGSGFARRSQARFVLDVLRHARRWSPDVVIASHVNLAPLARVAARLARATYWVNVYAIEVWVDLGNLRRRALLGASVVMSDCRFTKDLLERRYAELSGRIAVVEDCVDCERFTPGARVRDAGAPPSVLTVSRLAAGRPKGHDRIFEALAALREEGAVVEYVVAGDGTDRPRLEARAAELGIVDQVEFVGRVEDKALPDLYRSADVFALVSAFSLDRRSPLGEGVPLVVLEAQACGTPAVTSSRDGSAESIVDGRTGILVDPGDVGELTDALRRLVSDRELLVRLGAEAARLARERFSYDVFRERLRALVDRAGEGRTNSNARALRIGFIGERHSRVSDGVLRALVDTPDVDVAWVVDAELSSAARKRLYGRDFDYGPLVSLVRRLSLRVSACDLRRTAKQQRVPYLVPENRSINHGLPQAMYEDPDVEFVVMAGCDQILDESGLRIASTSVINYHYSLLPAYRGKNALFWQWWDEHGPIGFTFHRVDLGIDTGERMLQRAVERVPGQTMEELVDTVLAATREALPDLVSALRANRPVGEFLELPASYRSIPDYDDVLTIDETCSVQDAMTLFGRAGAVRLQNGLRLRALRPTDRRPARPALRWDGVVVPLADGAVIGAPTTRVPFWALRLALGRRLVRGAPAGSASTSVPAGRRDGQLSERKSEQPS